MSLIHNIVGSDLALVIVCSDCINLVLSVYVVVMSYASNHRQFLFS